MIHLLATRDSTHPTTLVEHHARALTTYELAIGVIVSVFVALCALGIIWHRISVLYWDNWDAGLEFYADVTDGKWSAWFAQEAEHRPILPRLLWWLDIRFFGYHFLLPLVGGLMFLVGSWILLLLILCSKITDRSLRLILGGTVTLLLTSWIQDTNFILGLWGSQWFMVTFFVLASLIATALSKDHPYLLYVGLACGMAAAGVTANGLIALPLMVLLALLIGLSSARVALIGFVSVVVLIAYFTNFVWLGGVRPSPIAALNHPMELVHYSLAYLGNVAFHAADYIVQLVRILLARSTNVSGSDYPAIAAACSIVAQIVGLGFIILSTVFAWRWLNSERNPLDGALIAFLIFVAGTAAATALGRSSVVGIVESPVHARYTTPTLMALACLIALAARSLNLRQAAVLFAVVAALLFPRQLSVLHAHATQYAETERAMAAVLENRDSKADRALLGNPDIVQRVANRLRAEKLGPWESNR